MNQQSSERKRRVKSSYHVKKKKKGNAEEAQKGGKTLLKTRQGLWKMSLKKQENKMGNKRIRESNRYRERQRTTNISWLEFLKKRTHRDEKVFQEIQQVTLHGHTEGVHMFYRKLTEMKGHQDTREVTVLCTVSTNTNSMTLKKRKKKIRPHLSIRENSGWLQTFSNTAFRKTAQQWSYKSVAREFYNQTAALVPRHQSVFGKRARMEMKQFTWAHSEETYGWITPTRGRREKL